MKRGTSTTELAAPMEALTQPVPSAAGQAAGGWIASLVLIIAGLTQPSAVPWLVTVSLIPACLCANLVAVAVTVRWRAAKLERVARSRYLKLNRTLKRAYWGSFAFALWICAAYWDSSWAIHGYASSDGRWEDAEHVAKGRDFEMVEGLFERWRREHADAEVTLVRTTPPTWWSPFGWWSYFNHPRWKVPYRPSSPGDDALD